MSKFLRRSKKPISKEEEIKKYLSVKKINIYNMQLIKYLLTRSKQRISTFRNHFNLMIKIKLR